MLKIRVIYLTGWAETRPLDLLSWGLTAQQRCLVLSATRSSRLVRRGSGTSSLGTIPIWCRGRNSTSSVERLSQWVQSCPKSLASPLVSANVGFTPTIHLGSLQGQQRRPQEGSVEQFAPPTFHPARQSVQPTHLDCGTRKIASLDCPTSKTLTPKNVLKVGYC